MTDTAVATDRDTHVGRVESQPVSFSRVVRSEWIKFASIRSSWALLAGATVGMIAVGLIVGYNTRHLTTGLQLDDIALSSTLQGYHVGELLIGALGVLFVTSEYSTGMVRSTFSAVPKRTPVLLAKLAVFVAVVAGVMIPVSVVAFTAAQAVISHSRVGYSLHDAGAVRVVIGTGIYLTLAGIFAASIGWLIRNTAGAIVTYIAVMLVLPGILGGLLGSWGRHLAQYLPSRAGESFSTTFVGLGPNLTPIAGLALMCAWVLALLVVAIVQLRRRDA